MGVCQRVSSGSCYFAVKQASRRQSPLHELCVFFRCACHAQHALHSIGLALDSLPLTTLASLGAKCHADVALCLQVTYPLWVGSLLHSVPLLLILASLGAKARKQSRAPGPQHFSSALLDGKGLPAGGQPPPQAALPLLQEVRRQSFTTVCASTCAASKSSPLLQGLSEHQVCKQGVRS